jgi:hypothetical protein
MLEQTLPIPCNQLSVMNHIMKLGFQSGFGNFCRVDGTDPLGDFTIIVQEESHARTDLPSETCHSLSPLSLAYVTEPWIRDARTGRNFSLGCLGRMSQPETLVLAQCKTDNLLGTLVHQANYEAPVLCLKPVSLILSHNVVLDPQLLISCARFRKDCGTPLQKLDIIYSERIDQQEVDYLSGSKQYFGKLQLLMDRRSPAWPFRSTSYESRYVGPSHQLINVCYMIGLVEAHHVVLETVKYVFLHAS